MSFCTVVAPMPRLGTLMMRARLMLSRKLFTTFRYAMMSLISARS